MTARVDLAEFLSAFVAEADEQLALAATKLLAIEQAERKGGRDPRSVRDAFRALHTIKGLASMVGVDAIVTLSHAMESVLRPADRAGGVLPAGAVDPLVRGVRAIELRVRALERGEPLPAAPDDLVAELDTLIGGPGSSKAAIPRLALDPAIEGKLAPFEREQLLAATGDRRPVRIDFAPSPERAERGLTINAVRDRVGALAEIVRVLPVSLSPGPGAPAGFLFALLVVTAASDDELGDAAGVEASCIRSMRPEPAAETQAPASLAPLGQPPSADEVELDAIDIEPPRRNLMRVNVARVDDAMDRLAALLVTRARLTGAIARLSGAGADTREVAQVAQENARQLRDLRSSILQVRMVPVIELLERLPLIVRALRRSTGKAVALKLDGGGAELDKSVADLVFPALVHLVRNAIDHGVEASEVRERAGKPPEATLRIACVSRSSTGVVISVEDDGRGIDAPAVLRKAGRAVPAEGSAGLATATDAALLDLICQPGLSTRDEATTTSGRGLGMDIVKRIVVDQLGGELELRTKPGQGTAFTLQIPLTVAIIDAFVVECGGQRFVVPVSMIEEVTEVDPAALVQPPRRPAGEGIVRQLGVAPRRREAMSLYELVGAARAPRAAGPALLKALVTRRRGEVVALVVDRVVGQQETIVRPLVDPLVRVPGITGATELGDGRPTLVLDIGALTATARSGGVVAGALGSAPAPRRLPAASEVAP